MEEQISQRRLSLRRVEISLSNFNSIAIPHHLDLLNKHRENILKFQRSHDLNKIKNEQINATRVIVQLKHLLEEMDLLRQRIIEKDLIKFDQMTEKSRKLTIEAIKEYMAMSNYNETNMSPSLSSGYSSYSPTKLNKTNCDTVSIDDSNDDEDACSLQTEKNFLTLEQLQQQEACLKSWEALQDEVQDLHELFIKFEQVIQAQGEPVNLIEDNIVIAEVNVETGKNFLHKAERFKTAWYPLAGAFVGGCIAGPIGLFTGLKIGGIALLGGSALGFTGGRILKKKQESNSNIQLVVSNQNTDPSQKKNM